MNINKAQLSAHYSKFPAITNMSPPFLSSLRFVVMFPACVRVVIVDVALPNCSVRLDYTKGNVYLSHSGGVVFR